MVLGFERINERTQRPNALINFIKPLESAPPRQQEIATGILNRVAAICYPFMKKHMIVVQALEEFPHNNEFVGRNFNAGEVIQLVLKNRNGEWLPERWIMMVMVHELAHCKQMNHSKAFWKVRNEYATDLKELWGKGYSGEGLWGRGRSLQHGGHVTGSVAVGDVPEQLCGGTYGRRRKRKRGRKEKEALSYAERKQRRILKKFGAGGQALGADDDTKIKLEGGVAKKGKPRVAGSARGRELRAQAALARFDQVKKEDPPIKLESDSETDDDYEELGQDEAAIDIDGKRIVDGKGHGLIKICEEEDPSDGNAKREMEEIQMLDIPSQPPAKTKNTSIPETANNAPPRTSTSTSTGSADSQPSSRVLRLDEIYKRRPESSAPTGTPTKPAAPLYECKVCSLSNENGSLTCVACSNVLLPDFAPNHWHCQSEACKDSEYINSEDAGVCGVCGGSRMR